VDGGVKGHYSTDHASAEVVTPTALPPSLDGVLELVRVWVDPEYRRQGYATELVKEVCNDADITSTVLMLRPNPFGEGGLENLVPFYERFGFTVIQKQPVVLMARMPQVYKTKFNPIAAAAIAATEPVRG